MFEKRRKRKEIRIVTPNKVSKKKKVRGVEKRGASDKYLAETGDLVMSTAKELAHSRMLFGDIDPDFFFGVVISADHDSVEVAWNRAEPQLRKAKVAKKKGERDTEDFRNIKLVRNFLSIK